jgi:hypothetical protein
MLRLQQGFATSGMGFSDVRFVPKADMRTRPVSQVG